MSIPNSLLGEAIRIEKERKKKGKKPTPEEVELRNEWLKETLPFDTTKIDQIRFESKFIEINK